MPGVEVISNGRGATPKSLHVSEDALRPFIQPDFDAASYLNSSLPSLQSSSGHSSQGEARVATGLADLSSQTQALLSQLNTYTSRLSNTLTQQTDEILRSGGRLAYEVEIFRGEVIALSETLNDRLYGEVSLLAERQPASAEHDAPHDEGANSTLQDAMTVHQSQTPIVELKTFSTVRNRLEEVIKIFGDAMQWTLPPSEMSLTSGFISISGPDNSDDAQTREAKGKAFSNTVREDILHTLTSGESIEAGCEAAMSKIESYRELAYIWKDTSEEKARTRFVDSLVKLLDEKKRDLEKASSQTRTGLTSTSAMRAAASKTNSGRSTPGNESGFGFMRNLQKIRGEFYLD